MNVSSTKDFFGSIRGSTAAKNAPPPVVATPEPAFPAKKSTFAPPPTRRLASDDSVPAYSPPPPAPPARHELEGEWAEALYDYDSPEAGDLNIRENQRVLVTDRSDDDWYVPSSDSCCASLVDLSSITLRWKGEFNGQSGVFPASYVRLL